MKRSAYLILAGLWFCLSPNLQVENEDGTLPLPRQDRNSLLDDSASIWDLICR